MTSPRHFSSRLRHAVTASLCALLITGCIDEKREQQLQWREEEAEAKISAATKIEREVVAERQRI